MTTERPTIVFFRTAYETLGGGSQMLLRLLSGLDTSEFRLILLTQKRDEAAERAEKRGAEVHIAPYRGKLNTYNEELLCASVATQLRAGLRLVQFNAETRTVLSQADVLWVDEIRSYLTVLPYILFSRTPVIWNIGLLKRSEGIMKYFHDIALRTTSYVFIESQSQAKRLFTDEQFETYNDKFVMFHKGVDTERFAPPASRTESNPVRIGTAALIHPRKGLEDLIKAVHVLEETDVELHIAGEPGREANEEYFNRLKSLVDDYDLNSAVVFHGWVDDMPAFYTGLDIFVLPSYNEGIPGSVREAMAMELPIVATDVGGTADVVVDDETGFLVDPGDVYSLSSCLEYLINNPGRRREMGAAGRAQIKAEFSLDAYVEKYANFLTSITESG